MSPLASDPFSPPRARETKSNNPKTIANRKAIHSKAGLDIADHRADAAFRSAKSRKLNALHRTPQWASWSEEKKETVEADIIRELEKKRDDRKRKAEVALFLKWEKEGVKQAGEDSNESMSDAEKNEEEEEEEEEGVHLNESEGTSKRVLRSATNIEEVTLGVEASRVDFRRKGNKRRRVTLKQKQKVLEEDDGWSTESDDSLSTSLLEAMKKGAKKFYEEMSRLEVKAEASSAELAEALAGANQE